MAFTEDSLRFLAENKLMDSKLWFTEHREEYETLVLSPLRQLVLDMAPGMLEIDEDLICQPKVGKCISRIYRDTRFSKDKSMFRDVMWVVFLRSKHQELPGFWFELSPRHTAWGCGWYCTDRSVLDSMRELIISGDRDFKKAQAAYKKQKLFTLEDMRYKRSKFPDQPEELRQWLDQKSICLTAESHDPEMLFGDDLAGRLCADFATLKPEYDFLIKACSRA